MPSIFKCQQFLQLAGLLFSVFTLLIPATIPHAQAAQIVARHNLDCSADFPCPEALRRRVDFWVEVFSRWDKSSAILHDNDEPWRVYQVVESVKGCSDKKVKSERKRLSANLNALADRLKKDQAPSGQIQRQLAGQFDRLNSRIVYKSAKNLRCQLGVQDQYSRALGRFERYKGLVSEIIADNGMPRDLLYLPFVESSYRADAYSKVGAAGMWQIMPNTARSLGMELNAVQDDRLDPEAATRGAMKYFKKSQNSLIPLSREIKPSATRPEINPFIVTSYNYGVNGMRRAIKQVGPDFPRVLNEYKSAAFQVAVKNFYASFLAARHLARHANEYFENTTAESPLRYQTFVLPVPTSVERIKHQFTLSEGDLKSLNPALTRFAWNNWRLIPAGYRLHLPYRDHRWTVQIDKLKALPPEPQSQFKHVYRVRRGDTACAIANAFRVSCKELISANRLGKGAMIRVGQKLDIPGRAPSSAKQTLTGVDRTGKRGRYTVKSGDTACGIATRYNVSCRELIRVNQLGRKGKIIAGQQLQIPGLSEQLAAKGVQPATARYTVRSGDTACEIAERYAILCEKLIADNKLGSRGFLRVGQVLTIYGRSDSASKNVSVSKYSVRSGDTICEIAERFDVPCTSLMRDNGLGNKGRIKIGQVLKITSTIGSSSINGETGEQQSEWLEKVDTPPDTTLITGAGHVTLRVLPDETLAHYSDWMGNTHGSAEIRGLNTINKGNQIQLGQSIKLPISSGQTREKFKARRSEFHQVLTEEFKERFRITEVRPVKIKSGQSLWSIANSYETPMWLLIRFNPGLSATLQPGQVIDVAMIERK